MPTLAQRVLPFNCTLCGVEVCSTDPVSGAKPHLRRMLCGPCKGRVNYAERTGRHVSDLRRRAPNGGKPPRRWGKSTVGQQFDCQMCGKGFVKKSHRQKFCGSRCARKSEYQATPVTTEPCEWCGKDVTGKRYKSSRRRFCGRKCQMAFKVCVTDGLSSREWPKPNPWQYARDRRDYVIERDGGRCVACRKRVVIGKPRHPRAAEIDHIVPVSLWPKGEVGMNDPSNLRLLCRTCNARKSNRTVPGGDQLLLIG